LSGTQRREFIALFGGHSRRVQAPTKYEFFFPTQTRGANPAMAVCLYR
jgi:hypothetical protein